MTFFSRSSDNSKLDVSTFSATKMQSTFETFNPSNDKWSLYKERLEIHMNYIDLEETKYVTCLLTAIGSQTYSVLRDLCGAKLPTKHTYKQLCEHLDTYFMPPTVIFKERKQFYASEKSAEQSSVEWLAHIQRLAKNCDFGANLERIILDKFVAGLSGRSFERMCEEKPDELTINKAVSIAAKYECTAESANVDFVRDKRTNINTYNKQKCIHCGFKNHTNEQCKYRKSKCHKCNKIGHISTVCRKKSINVVNEESSVINFGASKEQNEHCYSVNLASKQVDAMSAVITINTQKYKFMIDSGASVSLINTNNYEKYFNRMPMSHTNVNLSAYSGHSIRVFGVIKPLVRFGAKSNTMPFLIVDGNGPSILGRDFIQKFNLTFAQVNSIEASESTKSKLNKLLSEYSGLFDGTLGKFNGPKIHLNIKNGSDIRPVFCKPRTIPYAFRDKVEAELDRLEKMGVITLVKSNDWGTPLVPVLKEDGSLRLCADYKTTVNKVLEEDRHPLPRVDDLYNALEGGIGFSKVDMEWAYNQLVLNDESRKLCAWSTHRGVYLINRLPFGVKPATGIFQRTMEKVIQSLKGVAVFLDDIIVTGASESEHLDNLRALFERLSEYGFQLKKNKCSYFQSSVKYLGHIVNKDGLTKTTERVQSIIDAPTPKCVRDVRAWAGLVNYYGRYIPNLATTMNPLYNLLKKESKFKWNAACDAAVEHIKNEVVKKVTLAHFNPKIPIILDTDASAIGIGGVLSHRLSNGDERPIAFFSRTLNKAEENYPVIQKEALAIVESTKKFYDYLIGQKFTLRTDHRPLVSIFGEKTGIPSIAAARMQRWAEHLAAFNYTIEYKKGIENGAADALSRLPVDNATTCTSTDATYINFIENSGVKINYNIIRRETARDPLLSKVFDAVRSGKLSESKEETLQPFIRRDNELSIESGILMWGYRVIIPSKCREDVLKSLHASHLGVVKTKSLARSYLWWPRIDTEVEEFISKCEACAKLRPEPNKAKLMSWESTGKPWTRLHIDFAGPIDNFYYFIVMDSYSKWIEIAKTKTITANFTINKLRELFARFGLPEKIVSDAGTQFTAELFQNFCEDNRIEHIVIAPGHPASNGAAENSVKTFKKMFKASWSHASQEGQSRDIENILQRILMDYRSTVHCSTGETPAKVFLGREIRTRFNLLKPPTVDENIEKSQNKQQANYKGHRNISFREGEEVMIRDYSNVNHPSWMKAIVINVLGERNYLCKLNNGKLIKRHVNQIIKFGKNSNILDKPYRNVESSKSNRIVVMKKTFKKPKTIVQKQNENQLVILRRSERLRNRSQNENKQ